MINSLMC